MVMVEVPEFFASFQGDTSKDGIFIPKPIPFEEIKNHQEITSLTALWNYSSYHFNIRGEAIINGGRRIQLNLFKNCENTKLVCKRRHQLDVGVNNGKPLDKRLLYVLGLQCQVGAVPQTAVLLISEDGKEWAWRDFV